jgi:polar amino acid transport system permease protein
MEFSGEVFLTYLVDGRIARAALVTLMVATAAQAGATVIGFALAIATRTRAVLPRALAGAYIWTFRGTPPLLLLLLFYFGLPQLGLRLGVLEAGLLGLSLYGAAYMAEIIRGALASIDKGQAEAARSMGLSRAETMRSVLLPQAVRIVLPPFGNEFSSMMRTTSLLSVISFEELLRATTMIINENFRAIELYAVAALYYLAMASVWMAIQTLLERHFALSTDRRGATVAARLPA